MEMNPYAPAAEPRPHEPVSNLPDRPLSFGGMVHPSDIIPYGYSRAGTIIAALLLIVGVLTVAFVAVGLVISTTRSPNRGAEMAVAVMLLSVLVLALVGLPLWLLSRFRGVAYARMLRDWSPRIVGPVQGKFSEDLLELVYPHSRVVVPLDAITGVVESPQFIALSFDHRQMQVCLLPRHLFFREDDFLQATRLFGHLASERPLRPNPSAQFDPRLRDGPPLELMAMPEGSIGFAGTLTLGDFTATPVYRQQMRRNRIALLRMTLSIFVSSIVVSAVLGFPQFLIGLLVAILGIFAYSLLRWILSARQRNPDQPVANVSGWLSDQGLTYNSAIGSVAFELEAFEQIDADDHSIQLVLPGRIKQAVLLCERMFNSPDDFQQVRRWALSRAGASAPAHKS